MVLLVSLQLLRIVDITSTSVLVGQFAHSSYMTVVQRDQLPVSL